MQVGILLALVVRTTNCIRSHALEMSDPAEEADLFAIREHAGQLERH